MVDKLESPYPYFGGKSRVAPLIWEILGNVENYVEPFMGSAAILLGRPHEGRSETVNDFDSYVANFWRAVKYNAEEVAKHCDWPVNETDLIARQNWLVRQTEFRQRMLREPFYFDPQIAGWWCWGLCNWVGGGFCVKEVEVKMPAILDRGILTDDRIKNLYSIFEKLQKRLRLTHVACGDWSRVCSPTITYKRGLTGIVLDPPYGEGSMDYSVGGNKDTKVAKDVQKWAIENGTNEKLRIIYCGYEGQFNPPETWGVIEWKAQGGYGSGKGTDADANSYRERLWCSPSCLGPKQNVLFADLGAKIIPVKNKVQIQNVLDIKKEEPQKSEERISVVQQISGNMEVENRSEPQDEQNRETIETEKPKEEIVCICPSEDEPDIYCPVHFAKDIEEHINHIKETEKQIEKEEKANYPSESKELPKAMNTTKPIQKGFGFT